MKIEIIRIKAIEIESVVLDTGSQVTEYYRYPDGTWYVFNNRTLLQLHSLDFRVGDDEVVSLEELYQAHKAA